LRLAGSGPKVEFVDVLTDLLERTRARGSLFARSDLHAPWGFRVPAEPLIQFHVVLRGACLLRREGAAPLALHQGDVVFVVAEQEYELLDALDSPVASFAPFRHAARAEGTFVWPGAGERTRLLCGAYKLDPECGPSLLGQLPPVLCVSAADGHLQPALRTTLAALSDELHQRQAGSQLVVDRLVDSLLVHVLRAWMASGSAALPPWAAPDADPVVAQALTLFHAEPGRDWSVAAIAAEVRLSRSAFSRRFSRAMGEPPMAYLTRLRMTIAAELLRDSELPVQAIARRVGYDSVFAFSAAFKRTLGDAPTHFRQGSRPEARTASRRSLSR
jgi:AraC-like DNA-binding protein